MTDQRYCGNADALMSYLYEEGDAAERQAFEAHVVECRDCANDVGAMRAVRGGLAAWAPPETVLGFRIVREPAPLPRRSVWDMLTMPAWAQLAAASLAVAVAVGISGVEVRYDQQGWTMRAGWSRPAIAPAALPVSASPQSASTVADAPWRTELAALEQRLRGDLQPVGRDAAASGLRQASSAATVAPTSDQAFLARVRDLIEASETRQQREMAMRISQVTRDFDTQRRSDLTRVVDGMGALEGRTGAAVAQQRELLNYLVRVSQKQ
ncbi:MAG: zf-HC2 domain-containing protein [Acidobacteriota bacterium]